MKEVYRSAASILLLRRTAKPGAYEVLLLRKPRKRDAWQLPQGGREEGETIEEAALRELSEEAGIVGVKVLGKSTEVYQYDFPASYRRFRPDYVKGQRIEFIVAFSESDVTVQVDNVEVTDYAWVTPEDLRRHLKRKAYLMIVQRVYKEAEGMMD